MIRKELEFEDKKYCVLVPQESKDVISEGISNCNCVASYMDKILNGQCYLFFIRLIERKEESLLTLELREDKLVQCKGQYNRPATEEERQFLEKYCKLKDIKLQL